MWCKTLTGFPMSHNFVRNENNSCVYTRGCTETNGCIFLIFWVDDIILGSQSRDTIDATKCLLHDGFNMADRGELKWFLKIDFIRHADGNYNISQKRYADSILQRFGMANCKLVSTPTANGTQLQKATDDEHQAVLSSKFPYRAVIGVSST